MIEVRKTQFDVDIEEILKQIRTEVKLKKDLDILTDIKPSNEDLMVTCPVHSNGNESKPSCGININTGVFHCFTCGIRGGLDRFISYCFGRDDDGDYGYQWLVNNYGESSYATRKGLSLAKRPTYKSTKTISEEELDSYRYYHDYMWKRKLTPELVEMFDVGFDPNFTLKNKKTGKIINIPCLTFPVDDINGNILFIARRAVDRKFFHYPKTVDKPIYALSKCLSYKVIYVCESILNALTLWNYGFPAVALLGTGSENQINILAHCEFRKIILCLDGDKAGDMGIQRIFNRLQNITKISYIKMPRDGRDINDLSKDEFLHLKEIALN